MLCTDILAYNIESLILNVIIYLIIINAIIEVHSAIMYLMEYFHSSWLWLLFSY
jgi:hypothetical protein